MSAAGVDAAGVNQVRTGPRGRAPVVLLHPAGLDLTYWGGQIEALRDEHDVIAYDLAGHGRSAPSTGAWTFARNVGELLGVLDGAGAARAHLVGISVGGMIAQECTLAHPDRVASLSLIATASEFPADVRARMRDRAPRLRLDGMAAVIDETMQRWFTEETARGRPDLIDRATKTLLGDDAETHAQLWDAVSTLDTTARLPAIACPTLILVGEADPSCPPPAARRMQRQIVGSRLAVLPAASHMVILERPSVVNVHLASFLGLVAADLDQRGAE